VSIGRVSFFQGREEEDGDLRGGAGHLAEKTGTSARGGCLLWLGGRCCGRGGGALLLGVGGGGGRAGLLGRWGARGGRGGGGGTTGLTRHFCGVWSRGLMRLYCVEDGDCVSVAMSVDDDVVEL
jgi:hypothetical protein